MESDNSASLSAKVVQALAEHEDVSVTELDFSLYDTIDPDALDDLYRHTQSNWELTFAVEEYRVHVKSDGDVTVGDASSEKKHYSV